MRRINIRCYALSYSGFLGRPIITAGRSPAGVSAAFERIVTKAIQARADCRARMFRIALSLLLLFAGAVCCGIRGDDLVVPPAGLKEVSDERIQEIAAMLDDKPGGLGPTYRDRVTWEHVAQLPTFAPVLARAGELLQKSFPSWDEEAYLDYSRTGKRAVTKKMFDERNAWLAPLVWAECIENRGRFTARINKILEAYAKQKTWSPPYNDIANGNEDTVHYAVSLESADFANDLAQALYMLDDKVEPSVRQDVMEALRERTFLPVLTSLRTGRGHWWITAKMNWNPVCFSGVTGAALAVLPSRAERATIVAAAEHYSAYYLDEFGEDGYCAEGPSYYNYGFEHYILLRELIDAATHGKIDIFSDPRIRNIALYGSRIVILNNLVPPFEDCRVGTTIDPKIIFYCNRALGLTAKPEENQSFAGPGQRLTLGCLFTFVKDPSKVATATADADPQDTTGLRSSFDQAQVWVCRPAAGGNFGVALKGGTNDKPHNHNDIGSFVIVVGKEEIFGDPGGPFAYDAGMFGPQRYTKFKTFCSWGHPVPLVAGVQQKEGAQSSATIVQSTFTDASDTIAMEMQSAYPVPGLHSVLRTFEYSRAGAGCLAVRDDFEMEQPGTFETALTSHATWTRVGNDAILFSSNGETLTAKITASGDWDLTTDSVTENAPTFCRLAVRLKEPVAKGWINIVYTPGSTPP